MRVKKRESKDKVRDFWGHGLEGGGPNTRYAMRVPILAVNKRTEIAMRMIPKTLRTMAMPFLPNQRSKCRVFLSTTKTKTELMTMAIKILMGMLILTELSQLENLKQS